MGQQSWRKQIEIRAFQKNILQATKKLGWQQSTTDLWPPVCERYVGKYRRMLRTYLFIFYHRLSLEKTIKI